MDTGAIVNYELITRATCQYCLGNGRCYTCGGSGEADWLPCPDCEGSRGACPECEGGRETWLMFDQDGKRRGSCLNRTEIVAWRERRELPEWWNGFYGIKEVTE